MNTTRTNVSLVDAVPLPDFLSGTAAPSSAGDVTLGTLTAVKATLAPFFVPEQLALVTDLRERTHASATLIDGLTLRANAAAASVACGSVLAGHSSESDEFGDVGFWLGKGAYGSGQELAILRALGLENEAQEEIQSVSLQPSTNLPTSFSSHVTLTAEVRGLSGILSDLQELHCFRVRVGGSGTVILHVLTGRTDESWVGLLGLGVWSDA